MVDIHLDQAPDSPFMHPIVVAKTRKYGLQNQVTASHSFALGFQPREKILPVLDEMREVGIHLACVPNRSLEERVRIPRSKGVLVSLANDNVRDIWTRGGRADLVESGALLLWAMGISNDEGLEEVFDMISTFPARAMGLREHGLREGARADLVLFEAQSAPEVLLHQAAARASVEEREGRCRGGPSSVVRRRPGDRFQGSSHSAGDAGFHGIVKPWNCPG